MGDCSREPLPGYSLVQREMPFEQLSACTRRLERGSDRLGEKATGRAGYVRLEERSSQGRSSGESRSCAMS